MVLSRLNLLNYLINPNQHSKKKYNIYCNIYMEPTEEYLGTLKSLEKIVNLKKREKQIYVESLVEN